MHNTRGHVVEWIRKTSKGKPFGWFQAGHVSNALGLPFLDVAKELVDISCEEHGTGEMLETRLFARCGGCERAERVDLDPYLESVLCGTYTHKCNHCNKLNQRHDLQVYPVFGYYP